MSKITNFLLGNGEKLTRLVPLQKGGRAPRSPYSFAEAKQFLEPQIKKAALEIAALPDVACPRDRAVAVITLHPQYIAKSYYPENLLAAVGLQAVGSKPRKVAPRKWRPQTESAKLKNPPLKEGEGLDIFVAGQKGAFLKWAEALPSWTEDTQGADKLFEVEQFLLVPPIDRIRPLQTEESEPLLEVVLHAHDKFVLDSFEAYLETMSLKADMDRRFDAGSLCFLPLRAHRELLAKIAEFAYLRVMRGMPKLRTLRPFVRSFTGVKSFSCALPSEPPLDQKLKTVIFDGGIRDKSGLENWVTALDGTGVSGAVQEGLDHGFAVTSAALFGSLVPGASSPRPFSYIDHIRVLDNLVGNDPDQGHNLYDVLPRIEAVLKSGKYEFANLSIGPELPIDDDEVHAWTAMLDQHLSNGKILATVAAGNGGDGDKLLGFDRLQVPSDCVNALAVGASDRQGKGWRRAYYSSVGPGRSPGMVKPDILSFGGDAGAPFWVFDGNKPTQSAPTSGTSFSAPSVLRLALGARAHFGDVFTPLILRALLIHAADPMEHDQHEVGWGCIPNEIDDLVICPEGMARIIFKGELTPKTALRAHVPMPSETLEGNVVIHATLCFASAIDPAHPSNYTRSGVEVFFRPHKDQVKGGKLHPETKPFFQLSNYSSESERRRDAHKWETVLNRSKSYRATSLKDPAFDIYYHAREDSQAADDARKIPYALIVTVRSTKTKDLYDRIIRRHRVLTPITPVIQIPIRS